MTVFKKRFAVFDIDGTLIRWQMVHAIFDNLGRDGHLLQGDYEAILAARKAWKARKTIEAFKAYEADVVAIIERNIARLTIPVFNDAVTSIFEEYKDQVYRYTRDLIHDLKGRGYLIFAISGSPKEIVALLADYYGFDSFVGTNHVQKDGIYTGEIIVAAFDKPRFLRQLMDQHQVGLEGSIGVGDSEGDIDMLNMVETPVAFNPSKKLFKHAQQQGWKIVVERKNMVYELEQQAGTYKLARTNE